MTFNAKFGIDFWNLDNTALLRYEDTVTVNPTEDEEVTDETFKETVNLFGEEVFKNGFNYEENGLTYLIPAVRVRGFDFKLIDA